LRRRGLRAASISLTGLVLAACHVGQNPRPEVIDPDSASRADIRATLDAYTAALTAGNAHRIAAFFTPDARLAEPGMDDIEGANAIHAVKRSFYASGAVITDVEVNSEVVHVDGPDAFEFGSYSESVRIGGSAEQTVRGRYAIQWRRGPEARWRIRLFLINHLPAADTIAADTIAADTTAADTTARSRRSRR
jgi:uncharacterized protein (TIGR02246 family)